VLPTETLFWRRRIWERVGAGLDEGLDRAAGWDLALRFRAAGARFDLLPRFLAGRRIRAEEETPAGGARRLAEVTLLRERWHGRYVPPAEAARALQTHRDRERLHHLRHRAGLLPL